MVDLLDHRRSKRIDKFPRWIDGKAAHAIVRVGSVQGERVQNLVGREINRNDGVVLQRGGIQRLLIRRQHQGSHDVGRKIDLVDNLSLHRIHHQHGVRPDSEVHQLRLPVRRSESSVAAQSERPRKAKMARMKFLQVEDCYGKTMSTLRQSLVAEAHLLVQSGELLRWSGTWAGQKQVA